MSGRTNSCGFIIFKGLWFYLLFILVPGKSFTERLLPPLSVLYSWGDAAFAQTLIRAEGFIPRWENRGMEEEKWRDVISRERMCRSCHRRLTVKASSPAASSQQTCQTRPDHSCWLQWAPHESLTQTTAHFFYFCYRHILYQRHC